MTMKKAEIVRVCDVSARLVTLTASLTLNEADHEGKILLMGASGAALTFTLPLAIGSGARYKFMVSVVNSSNYIIAAASGDDFDGWQFCKDGGGPIAQTFLASAGSSNTFTWDGDTQGGLHIGDFVEFIDILSGTWSCNAFASSANTEATPFS